jgi:hypothetical protein
VVGFTALGIGSLIVLLAGLVLCDPASYRRAAVAEGEDRRRLSGEMQSTLFNLIPGNLPESDWHEEFTSLQINSYFAEDFVRAKPFPLPDGIHSPRITLHADRLSLAFRFGHGFWSTVLTVDLRAWLVAGELNTIAVEIVSTRAGRLPVSLRTWIERYLRSSRDWSLDVTWYRRQGNAVALIRINSDPHRLPFRLQQLEIQPDKFILAGHTTEDARVTSLPR